MNSNDHNRTLTGSAYALIFLVILAAEAKAMEVQIIPSLPTNNDIIQIKASGILFYCDSPFDHSDFCIDGFSLQLDIYYGHGYLTALGPWLRSEYIGPLPGGTYDLTITHYEGEVFPLVDTYSTSFEVVPEPMSLSLLLLGAFALRFRKNKKATQ
ncbi:MAG: PEP-CTERM sorting domain-containing protein [Sedimentisphaerales bacterium]|nr:PEP-CTERM sorting domain-containing protein [Sedimentisphaerales bacterium]